VPVPAGHEDYDRNGFTFVLPEEGSPGPYYFVLQGLRVGLFSGRQSVTPFIESIADAKCEEITDGMDAGIRRCLEAAYQSTFVVIHS